MKKVLLVASLIALSIGCSSCGSKTDYKEISEETSSSNIKESSNSSESLSADAEKVINHSIFKDYDEKKAVADEIGDNFNYAYDWDLSFDNDDIEYAFIDYLYYLAGAYPTYAELLGGEAVDGRYAVWEGNGYTIGTIVAEDGMSAEMYIKFTDSTLREKLDKLNEEKDKQSKEIANRRNSKHEEFTKRISTLENIDSIPLTVKNYNLYADCIVSYGKSSENESEQDYSTKTLESDRLDGLIDLLLESTYTNIEQEEIDEKINNENVEALLAFELLNDCNLEDLVNNPTNLGYVVYFKDGSMNYYLDTMSNEGEYITYIVNNDKFNDYLSPIYAEMIEEALKNKEVETEVTNNEGLNSEEVIENNKEEEVENENITE